MTRRHRRTPLPPMTSEEVGKLEEKLMAWKDYYNQERDEAKALKALRVSMTYGAKAVGFEEALLLLRGSRAAWPPGVESPA